MKKKLMFIEPTGGLCNRLNAIVSSYFAAEASGKKLILIWRNKNDCNCSYDLLFDLPDSISSIIINQGFFENKAINQIPKLFGRNFFTDPDIDRWINENSVYDNINRRGNIYLRTCYLIYEPNENHIKPCDYSIIRPKQDILRDIPEIFSRKDLTGIHIRRTDNVLSIENSPLELFIEKMDHELDLNKNSIFFIATDDVRIKEQLQKRYGSEHIFTRSEIELSRAAQNGIRDAYIDLLCLSRCKKIYGSYWSSFSRCAAAIGKIPLEICRR
jgi:hypothetical protein